MIKILTVVGARPQFIKAQALSAEIARIDGIKEVLLHSGQHYDSNLSDVFFDELELPQPKYNLCVGSSTNTIQAADIMKGLDQVLEIEKPDAVVVFGDTNTTLAAAIASCQGGYFLAHVEAGLRSNNLRMLEEVNRRVTDHLSQKLYVPGKAAENNLKYEGISDDRILNVGDIMLDVLLKYKGQAKLPIDLEIKSGFTLLTLHRAENVDNLSRLTSIVALLEILSLEMVVVCPLHPRTRQKLEEAGLFPRWLAAVNTIEPQSYLSMLGLILSADLVLTDSGGLQKEAFYLERPCRTLRSETEWNEIVDGKWNALVDPHNFDAADSILSARVQRGPQIAPYGKGNSAQLIVQDLLQCVG